MLRQIENHESRATILPALTCMIEEMQSQLPPSAYGLVGICIGIHGVIHENQLVFVPYSPYQGIDFAGSLEQHFHIPVLVENEANLSALGEWAYCFHTRNMLSISVHSGIGVGIIMDDQLITGQNGYAGEFGHTIISIDGRPCPLRKPRLSGAIWVRACTSAGTFPEKTKSQQNTLCTSIKKRQRTLCERWNSL